MTVPQPRPAPSRSAVPASWEKTRLKDDRRSSWEDFDPEFPVPPPVAPLRPRPVSTLAVIAFSVVAVVATFLTWYPSSLLGDRTTGPVSAWGEAAAIFSHGRIFGSAMYAALVLTCLSAVALIILVTLRIATRRRGPIRLILGLALAGFVASAGLVGGYSFLGVLPLEDASAYMPLFGLSFIPVLAGAAGLTVVGEG